MILDGYTFPEMSSSISPLIRKKKAASYVETYSSVVFFDWGSTYAGLKIDLTWDYMSTTMFDQLETKYLGTGPFVFNPEDGKGKTFNVEILSLDGEYHMTVENRMIEIFDSEAAFRKNVKMSLVFISEV